MEKVMGIGGIFFKAKDKAALASWYQDNLGLPVDPSWGGAVISWKDNDPKGDAHTVWSPFAADTTYFAPSEKPFMLNFRVANLDRMLAQLRDNGCDVDDKIEDSDFGRFGWVMDPEGNRIELWQPPAG
ncbi:MAG: VOC family protein [Myxococcales bacterium]|nr:VOC family protein [Myxococcales bacterium]